ncbi:Uncharacterised protein [Vibrio cholerae]|nr:Uncharacterised protein [Vibrio cholerae]CSI84905.1 Uncharacterised protein [Vibrio cholerae]
MFLCTGLSRMNSISEVHFTSTESTRVKRHVF